MNHTNCIEYKLRQRKDDMKVTFQMETILRRTATAEPTGTTWGDGTLNGETTTI